MIAGRGHAAALTRTGLSNLAAQPGACSFPSANSSAWLWPRRLGRIEPEILWLDEPTASLDPAATFAVEGIIEAMHRAGCKIVMTTHDLVQGAQAGR